MDEKPSDLPQNTAATSNRPGWEVYLALAIISGAGGFLSVIVVMFSGSATAVFLAICNSIACFTFASILAFNRRSGFAFLLSLATAPIFGGLANLYIETRSFQVELGRKAEEIGHQIVAKINDPQPALDRAIRDGYIRKATAEDVRAFRDAYIQKKYISKNLAVPATENALSVTKVDLSRAYVVLKKFTYPSGLVNEYRVVFFIPAGIPEPSGDIGHSAFYDFGTLTIGCTVARTGGISC